MIEKRGKDFYEYSYHAALFNQKYILPDVRNQDEDECVFNSLAAGADMGVRKERAKGGLTSDITFDAKSLAQDFLAEESALGLGGLGVLNIQDTARRLFKQQGVFARSSEWAGPQALTIEGSEELTLEEYEKILRKKSSDPTKPEEMKNTSAVIKGVQLLEKEVENDARVKLENCQLDAEELTLEEYEKILRKKSSDPTKPEEMKNTPAVIKGVQLLEKEVENDARVKLENCQLDAEGYKLPGVTEAIRWSEVHPSREAKQAFKHRGGRSNGGYNGPSRDSSMEPWVYNSRYGENTTLLDNADMTQGNVEPRRENGYYNGTGTSRYQDRWGGSIGQRWGGRLESSDGSKKAADKSSIKEYLKPTDGQDSVPPLRRDDHSNGGYRGGRNNLRYQSRRHGYNGEPWEGTHQQGRYNNGRVHNGHQERRDQQGSHNV